MSVGFGSAGGGALLSVATELEQRVTDSLTILLSTLLLRTIIVGTVLLVLKYLYEGAFLVAGTLLLALSFSAYLLFTDAKLLE